MLLPSVKQLLTGNRLLWNSLYNSSLCRYFRCGKIWAAMERRRENKGGRAADTLISLLLTEAPKNISQGGREAGQKNKTKKNCAHTCSHKHSSACQYLPQNKKPFLPCYFHLPVSPAPVLANLMRFWLCSFGAWPALTQAPDIWQKHTRRQKKKKENERDEPTCVAKGRGGWGGRNSQQMQMRQWDHTNTPPTRTHTTPHVHTLASLVHKLYG